MGAPNASSNCVGRTRMLGAHTAVCSSVRLRLGIRRGFERPPDQHDGRFAFTRATGLVPTRFGSEVCTVGVDGSGERS